MTTPSFRSMHPLMAIAAVSLTMFSLLGIGAITGLITPANSQRLETLQAAPLATASGTAQAANEPRPDQTGNAAMPQAKASAGNTQPARHQTNSKAESATKGSSPGAASSTKACTHCGQVESINLVKHDGEASGLGAVAGGVAGGVIGNQIGKGKGNILMTILGAGGGAYAGHTIEQKVKATTAYVVKVHMNDGSTRTVTMADKPTFAVGDQVKVINGGLSVVS